jgi:hypothetical protein
MNDAKVKLIFLDASRDNPFSADRRNKHREKAARAFTAKGLADYIDPRRDKV